MITIRSAIKLAVAVYLLGLAIYDIRHKRVRNEALLVLLGLVLLGCTIEIWQTERVWLTLASMVLGAISGGGILLAAAVVTKGGIGGGDIKLAAVLGLAVGFEGMLAILIVASLLALIVGTVKRLIQKEKNLRLAFVPFIAAGYYLTLVPQFI